jgi:hypothetical protein
LLGGSNAVRPTRRACPCSLTRAALLHRAIQAVQPRLLLVRDCLPALQLGAAHLSDDQARQGLARPGRRLQYVDSRTTSAQITKKSLQDADARRPRTPNSDFARLDDAPARLLPRLRGFAGPLLYLGLLAESAGSGLPSRLREAARATAADRRPRLPGPRACGHDRNLGPSSQSLPAHCGRTGPSARVAHDDWRAHDALCRCRP